MQGLFDEENDQWLEIVQNCVDVNIKGVLHNSALRVHISSAQRVLWPAGDSSSTYRCCKIRTHFVTSGLYKRPRKRYLVTFLRFREWLPHSQLVPLCIEDQLCKHQALCVVEADSISYCAALGNCIFLQNLRRASDQYGPSGDGTNYSTSFLRDLVTFVFRSC